MSSQTPPSPSTSPSRHPLALMEIFSGKYLRATERLVERLQPGIIDTAHEKIAFELKHLLEPLEQHEEEPAKHSLLKHNLEFGAARASGLLAFIALITAVFTVIPTPVGISFAVIVILLFPSLLLIRLFYPIGYDRVFYENSKNLNEYLTEFQSEIGIRLAIQQIAPSLTVGCLMLGFALTFAGWLSLDPLDHQ